jgi:hypothetical protein
MFDEAVIPDVRHFFEDILSKLSVFMAQQGTPTVRILAFSSGRNLRRFEF